MPFIKNKLEKIEIFEQLEKLENRTTSDKELYNIYLEYKYGTQQD